MQLALGLWVHAVDQKQVRRLNRRGIVSQNLGIRSALS
jgi:hypothetical protein